ncbi:MAG: hypothetical protein JWO45_849 [Spartobacteria bacterium]|nr:hypothetical protein [Spartobacteria bacterium]
MITEFFPAKAIVFLILSASCLAAPPGGYIVEAVSDECETLSPIWGPGLRGMPEFLTIQDGALSIRSIDNGDDSYPSAEDMISTYSDQIGRALDAAEGPNVVTWIWLPPFQEWPTGFNASGFREWLGFRVTAYDADLSLNGGLYFPGIYVATDDTGPCFIARVGDGYGPDVTIGRIAAAGWWTLGLSWNAQGKTEYYAAPGRVTLTSADLLHVTPQFPDPAANRSIDQLIGNFIALRMTYPPTGQLSPNWLVDSFRVYVKTAPHLPVLTPRVQGGQIDINVTAGSRGFRYLLQRSEDLADWQTVASYLGDGNAWIYSEPAAHQSFYRVVLP